MHGDGAETGVAGVQNVVVKSGDQNCGGMGASHRGGRLETDLCMLATRNIDVVILHEMKVMDGIYTQ